MKHIITLIEIIEPFHGSIFAFVMSILITNTEPLLPLPYTLRAVLFPFTKSDGIQISKVILRIYAYCSAIFSFLILILPSETPVYVPGLITAFSVLSLSLAVEVFLWIRKNWRDAGILLKAGSIILMVFLLCVAAFAVALDVVN